MVWTLFDPTGSLVALSTEAKKFSGREASLEMRREAANDVAALISLLPAERRAMLGIAELADVAILSTESVPVGVAKAAQAICDRLSEGFAPLPKAVSRR